MRFGMREYSQIDRMNGLNYLVTRGLDRSAPEFQIVKPLLHAMCLKREEEATITKGQGDNMGAYVKDSEFVSVNGKYLNDCMTPYDVALLILVIENNITKSDKVSKNQLGYFLFSDATNMISDIFVSTNHKGRDTMVHKQSKIHKEAC